MRKHRLFGVVIAVLCGAGLFALLPRSPHQAVGTTADMLLARDASAITSVDNTLTQVHAAAFAVTPDGPSSPTPATMDKLLALTSPMKPLPPLPVTKPAVVVRAVHTSVVTVSNTAPSGGVWLALRRCESDDNYSDDTGNGYYGAYQFSLATWRGLGYSGLPSQASPAEQDAAAQRLQARGGWSQWPACSARLGL